VPVSAARCAWRSFGWASPLLQRRSHCAKARLLPRHAQFARKCPQCRARMHVSLLTSPSRAHALHFTLRPVRRAAHS
jgi:hypothetical protein